MSQVERKTPKSSSRFSWKDVVQRGMFLSSLPLIIALSSFVMISFLAASGVFIVQCFLWLSEGEWVGMSAELFFSFFLPSSNPLVQWLDDPQAWHGAHTLITGTSLSVFLVLIAVKLFVAYAVISDDWASRHRRGLGYFFHQLGGL